MNIKMKRDRWRDIRAALEKDIMDGILAPGAQLPTEPELALIHKAGRHSVRRAIAELAKTGHLSIEQGRGTFVQPRPKLEYMIGTRTRLRRNMASQGVDVSGQALCVDRLQASAEVASHLKIEEGAEVIASRRLSLADGVPISFGTIYHDARRFAYYAERREALGSVSQVYASYGILDYVRASTQMYARPASAEEARQLRQHSEMPVIVVSAVDAELDGTPLSFSEVIWSAARVRFSIDTSPETEA